MGAKQTVGELLDRLPDDCSLEDVLYHLYVVQEVQKGRVEIAAGKGVTQEQVAEALRRKWQIGADA